VTDFLSNIEALAAEFEPHLAANLPTPEGLQSRVVDAMRYAALGGGKRLRPFFVAATARMLGYDNQGIWLTASALECLHVYSLVHDDLPCMDDDDVRRGKPTVHKAFDEATAVLAGDALLTHAFDLLSREDVHSDPAVRLSLISMLARASGHNGMIGGQMIDLTMDSHPATIDTITRLQDLTQMTYSTRKVTLILWAKPHKKMMTMGKPHSCLSSELRAQKTKRESLPATPPTSLSHLGIRPHPCAARSISC